MEEDRQNELLKTETNCFMNEWMNECFLPTTECQGFNNLRFCLSQDSHICTSGGKCPARCWIHARNSTKCKDKELLLFHTQCAQEGLHWGLWIEDIFGEETLKKNRENGPCVCYKRVKQIHGMGSGYQLLPAITVISYIQDQGQQRSLCWSR